MSFWTLSNNEEAKGGDFESAGGNFEPIPDGTKVIASVEEVALNNYEGEDYFNVKWRVLEGEFINRIIFQKLKVFSNDSKVRDKAITVLASIDSNAGGKLMAAGKEPTEMSMASALLNKPMILLLRVWETDADNTGKTKKETGLVVFSVEVKQTQHRNRKRKKKQKQSPMSRRLIMTMM